MRIFDQDMRALNAIPPDVAPRATQEIPEMQRLIRAILDKGQAYVRQGTVYFRVASVPQYGSLSRFDRARMLAVNREFSENPDDPLKEDPLDFPIWKAAGPGEPTWDSPWGPGRPGWHIECSAMSERYLGVEFDLHGGGEDLIFPHHENELAQSAGFSGRYPFAHVWMHVGMVHLGGIKMSKSLGNMVFARDLLRRYTPDAIRLYLLRQPYREPLDYDEAELAACEARVQQLRAATEGANSRAARPDSRAETGREAALAALDDNLDTPRALAVLEQLAAQAREDRERDDPSPVLAATIRELGERLGLMLR
jgi:L-cysteine:1D-myo-inositol 2-amino-2-deoxy-alpha-D-glucopyranoside ligase